MSSCVIYWVTTRLLTSSYVSNQVTSRLLMSNYVSNQVIAKMSIHESNWPTSFLLTSSCASNLVTARLLTSKYGSYFESSQAEAATEMATKEQEATDAGDKYRDLQRELEEVVALLADEMDKMNRVKQQMAQGLSCIALSEIKK